MALQTQEIVLHPNEDEIWGIKMSMLVSHCGHRLTARLHSVILPCLISYPGISNETTIIVYVLLPVCYNLLKVQQSVYILKGKTPTPRALHACDGCCRYIQA